MQVFSNSIVFGLVGVVIAFLEIESSQSIISGILPAIVVGLTVLFQLLGRLKPSLDVPIDSQPSIVGASNALVCFLFSIAYFEYFH